MEVYLPESDDIYPKPVQRWESLGEKILWANLICAGCAAVPALLKKKRVYTMLTIPVASVPDPPAAQAAEEPSDQPDLPEQLRCPQIAKNKIIRLFTTIADQSVITNGPFLWRLGREIKQQHHVHPLALLMNMPRDKIQKIFNSQDYSYTFARIPTIMNGIESGMNQEYHRLNALIPAFAAHMQKDEIAVKRLIQARDWRGLVHFLFDINA